MFEGLDWKWALRRAAIVVAIYLALMYILSQVMDGFGNLNWSTTIIQAAFFFLVFTVVYAYVERSRRRRLGQQLTPNDAKSSTDEEREPGPMKGKPNPNQSKKKATRRRR